MCSNSTIKNGTLSDFCTNLQKVIDSIYNIRKQSAKFLTETVTTIKQLIPETKSPKIRISRSFIPFVGKIFKSAFGLVTGQDCELLSRHVRQLQHQNQFMMHRFQRNDKQLSSFMMTVDHRLDTTMTAVDTNHKQLMLLEASTRYAMTSLQSSILRVTNLLTNQIMLATELDRSLFQMYSGFNDLIQGKLSVSIIPYNVLHPTIIAINSELAKQNANFKVFYKDITHLYQSSNYAFQRKGDKVYIMVKFPLTTKISQLTVYQIQSLPVRINDSTTHATQILDLPHYLGISHNHQYFAEIGQDDFDLCQGKFHKHCPYHLPLQLMTQATCATSVFQQQTDNIRKLCNFRFIPAAIKAKIQPLSKDELLLYKIPKYTLQCEDNQYILEGCSLCIIKVKCKCSFFSNNYFLPLSLQNCAENSTEPSTKVYPVNLAMLQGYFSDNDLTMIYGDTKLEQSLEFKIPNFTVYNH